MAFPISESKDIKEKFVPKRRAPYLLQDEVIQKKISIGTISEAKISNESQEEKKQKISAGIANKGINGSFIESENKSKSSQLAGKLNLNYHEEVSKLCGIQKQISHYLVNCCIARRDTITGSVTSETLCKTANTTKKTLKKILQRMIEKKLIARVGGKRGKGGFSVFNLEKDFIDVVRLQLDLENNNLSSAQQKNHNHSTASVDALTLPQEWQDIDFTAINEIGFGVPQLKQLYSKNITTPNTIQDSINHFAFALENRPEKIKKYSSKIAALMSVLNKGGAWVEGDYSSPQEIAFKKLAENKIARSEKLKKMEEEFLTSEFELWEAGLTEQEKDELIPEDKKTPHYLREMQNKMALKSYFKKTVWQEKMPEELRLIKKELQ